MRHDEQIKTPPLCGFVGFSPTHVLWHDLIVADSPGHPEQMEVLNLLAERWFPRPIAPQRWKHIGPAVLQELRAQAEAHGATPEQELKRYVTVSLIIALREGDASVLLKPRLRKHLQKRMNDLVTEDLLGPNWRERPPEDIGKLDDVVGEFVDQAVVEARLEIESLMARASLSVREAEVIKGELQGEERLIEIAERLGATPGSVRMSKQRALRKLREAAGH